MKHEDASRVIKKRHVVLLILSCVLLLISLSGAWDLAEVFLLPDAPTPPSDQGTGMGWFGVFLGEVLRGFGLFVLLAAVIPCWGLGTVIAVLLTMNKQDKPKWLWVASLVLALVYLAAMLVMLALWFLT